MIYAMPGMRSQLHAVLDRPVEAEGFSANYSGSGFSDMRFKLRGVDDAAFQDWVAEARAAGNALDLSTYRGLLAPSERVPVMKFASIDSDLFRRVVERCVDPGTTCMSEMMAHGDHQP
jgi:cytochrome o ubiquinol oxidase subunit 2